MENQNIEWKESWHDEYLKWVSAFANAQGGIIEIGRNDEGVVIGVSEPEKLLEDLPNKIRNTTGVLADVDIHSENGLQYITIVVQPYPAPIAYHGMYYYRTGSTTQLLSGSSLDEFLLRKQGKTWDGVPVPFVRESEFERDAFHYFRRKAVESTRLSPEDLNISDEALLKNLMLTEGDYLRRSAIILFHHNPEKWVPGAYVKIGYFENEADLSYQDEIHGAILTMPDKVLDTLYLKYFKGLISYEGIQRIETYPVARAALREAVLNSITHKDYNTGVPIQIRVYKDRVSIYNPGGLPADWTLEKLLSSHGSYPRNPLIAGTFYRCGMIETWGRGIQKIITACHEAGRPDPIFDVSKSDVFVLFTDNRQHADFSQDILPVGTINGIINGIINGTINFDDTQRALLYALAENPKITFNGLSEKTRIPRRTISREMKKLGDMGIIERIGAKKNGYWSIKVV